MLISGGGLVLVRGPRRRDKNNPARSLIQPQPIINARSSLSRQIRMPDVRRIKRAPKEQIRRSGIDKRNRKVLSLD